MPIFRIYNKEVKDLPRKKLSESWRQYYDHMLKFYAINQYGEAELYAGENIQEVSRLLCETCQRLNIGIEIISEHRNTLFFKIIDNQQLKMEI